MKKNKKDDRVFFRVFKLYKKAVGLGLFFGVSLVLCFSLLGQVMEDRKPSLLATEYDGGGQNQVAQVEEGEENGQNQVAQVEKGEESGQDSANLKGGDDPIVKLLPPLISNRFTVLLVGVDRRPGETSLSNTDTLIVASINADNGKVALLSIPRDTQVTIPGHGKGKINSAARIGKGGLNTTIDLLEGLIGQPIDGFVLTNFTGFKTIIDTLDGITLTVEKNMHYTTGDLEDGVIDLDKGTQRLNGTQALQYARFRQDALADITRTTRQQAVLKAMKKEFLQIKTIPKLPWLLPQISKSVETNLSLGQLWKLSNVLFHFDKSEISSQTLPGNFFLEKGISYWKVDTQRSHEVVKQLFEQGETSSIFFK